MVKQEDRCIIRKLLTRQLCHDQRGDIVKLVLEGARIASSKRTRKRPGSAQMRRNGTAQLSATVFARGKGPFVVRAKAMRQFVHKQACGLDGTRVGQAAASFVATNRGTHQVVLARLSKVHASLRDAL